MRAGIALVCRINDADTLLHTKPTITSHVVFATYNRHVIFFAERYNIDDKSLDQDLFKFVIFF